MKHTVTYTTAFSTSQEANAVRDALPKEVFKNRAHTDISVNGAVLTVVIHAQDGVALRAIANSYMRYLQVVEGTGGNDEE